jgi:hypothetical protein
MKVSQVVSIRVLNFTWIFHIVSLTLAYSNFWLCKFRTMSIIIMLLYFHIPLASSYSNHECYPQQQFLNAFNISTLDFIVLYTLIPSS